MTDDPSAEPTDRDGVEHLVTAGHELIAAARGFLDAVEDALADSETVSAAVGSITGFVESAGSAVSRLMDRRVDDDAPSDRPSDAEPDRTDRPSRRLRPIDVEFFEPGSSHVADNEADI